MVLVTLVNDPESYNDDCVGRFGKRYRVIQWLRVMMLLVKMIGTYHP